MRPNRAGVPVVCTLGRGIPFAPCCDIHMSFIGHTHAPLPDCAKRCQTASRAIPAPIHAQAPHATGNKQPATGNKLQATRLKPQETGPRHRNQPSLSLVFPLFTVPIGEDKGDWEKLLPQPGKMFSPFLCSESPVNASSRFGRSCLWLVAGCLPLVACRLPLVAGCLLWSQNCKPLTGFFCLGRSRGCGFARSWRPA